MNRSLFGITRNIFRGIRASAVLLFVALGFASTAQATTIAGDFNGDGIADTLVFNAGSGTISIVRGGGKGTGTYNTFSNWITVTAIDTNGVGGLEVAVTFASGYVFIADDRARTSRGYNVPGGSSTNPRYAYFYDLNGAAGAEALFVYGSGGVAIVDDRLHAVRNYNVYGNGFGGPTRWVKIGEFNGVAGNEVMFSYMSGTSQVLDDRLRTVRTYNYLSDGSAPTYANVDGVAGLEGIFHYFGSTIWVVDRTRSILYR